MIIYYTRAPGRGHITRTAALARRQEGEVLVVHFSDWTEPLDWAGVPHVKSMLIPHESRKKATQILVDGRDYYRLNQRGSEDGLNMEENPVILPFDHEILSREAAREALNLPAEGKVLFALTNLFGDSISGYLSHVPEDWTIVTEVPYPAAIYLRAADAVIGNAGYNLYHETKHVGVPAFLIPDPMGNDQMDRAGGQKWPYQFAEFLATIGS